MAYTGYLADGEIFATIAGSDANVNLESSHRVINKLMEALQRNFKSDTQYARPLISPQQNIAFALDKEAAETMVEYMTAKLKDTGCFTGEEFRFVRKTGANDERLQRIRLEFTHGVNANIIHKLLIAIDTLERTLPPFKE